MGFKKFFCQHVFVVKEAVFEYGASITPQASKGLTSTCGYYDADVTNSACPKTVIKTHYVVNGKLTVSLYCKVCKKCGCVKPCDAFEYEEYKAHNNILSSAGL